MSTLLRAIVVGCGKIAGGYNSGLHDAEILTHALAYKRHSSYSLAACVDTNVALAEAFAEKWKVPRYYTSLDAALKNESFDVASICTPTGTHIEILKRFSSSEVRGVFIEKPIDGDAEGARSLAKIFGERGVPVVVNFTRRFDPVMRELREEVLAGSFGELVSIVGWYTRGILNNGSHLIDLIAFLTGRVGRVVAVGAVRQDGVPGDPTIAVLLDCDGASVHLVPGDGRAFARFEIELAFERAVLTIEESGAVVRRREVASSTSFSGNDAPTRGTWSPTQEGKALLVALDEMEAAIDSGAPLTSDLVTAASAIELCRVIQSSAQASNLVR